MSDSHFTEPARLRSFRAVRLRIVWSLPRVHARPPAPPSDLSNGDRRGGVFVVVATAHALSGATEDVSTHVRISGPAAKPWSARNSSGCTSARGANWRVALAVRGVRGAPTAVGASCHPTRGTRECRRAWVSIQPPSTRTTIYSYAALVPVRSTGVGESPENTALSPKVSSAFAPICTVLQNNDATHANATRWARWATSM